MNSFALPKPPALFLMLKIITKMMVTLTVGQWLLCVACCWVLCCAVAVAFSQARHFSLHLDAVITRHNYWIDQTVLEVSMIAADRPV